MANPKVPHPNSVHPAAMDSGQALRQQAEETISRRLESSSPEASIDNPGELVRLFHELQVHQVELGLQNVELQRAHAALNIEQARYFDLFDLAPVGYLSISGEGLILEANSTAATLLGVTGGALLEQPFSCFVVEEDQPLHRDQVSRLFAADSAPPASPREYELRLRRWDDSTFWGHITANLVVGGVADPPAYHVAISDISEPKRVEAELIRARQSADAANRAKSAFLANMSHELRTPLNAILGFAQVMERDPTLPDHQRHRALGIRRGGEYLLALINDVLNLAKVEAGQVDTVSRDWQSAPFFEQLLGMVQSRASSKGLSCRFRRTEALPSTLRGDEIRLRQVLMNLLGNAIKFTDQGGVILSADYRRGRLRLEVTDSGTGMTPEDMEHIFEPFVQVGAENTRAQGTGLGLAISRWLVEAMGGTLNVESAPGHGSRFWFEVPMEAVADKSAAGESRATDDIIGYQRRTHGGAFTLLTVDDIADCRENLRELLTPLGFEIGALSSGAECLERVAASPPDAVLLDLRMPYMNGLEVVARLRTMPGLDGLVIIAVTASAFPADARDALAAGCDGHLAKPVILGELMDELARHLPLEWLRRPIEPDLARSGLRPLSEDERQQLRGLLAQGKITEVERTAALLVESDDPPREADELLAAAERLDFKRIEALLTPG